MPQTDPLIIVPITKKRVGQLANSMFLSLPSSPLIESKKEEKYKLCKVDDITGSYLPPSPNCDGHESYHDLEENELDYFSFAKIDYLIAPTTEKESILKNRHTFAFSRLNCPSPVKNYFNPPNNNNDNININNNNNNNNNSNYNINNNNNNDDNNSFNNKHKILESEELVLQLEDNHLPSVPPMSPSSSLSEESDIDDISHQILDTDTDTNTNSKSSPELKAQYSKDDLSEFINYNKYNSIRKKKVSKKIEKQSRHSIIKNFF